MEPDYPYLIRLNQWSKKDAALIISGLNPGNYRQQKFYPTDIPPELNNAFKLYNIFKTNIHPRHQEPIDYLKECHRIAWPIAENLKIAVIDLFGTRALPQTEEQNMHDGLRERQNLLKLVGILVKLYVGKSSAPRYLRENGKINTSSVIDDILQYVTDNCPEMTGLGKSVYSSRNEHSFQSESERLFH